MSIKDILAPFYVWKRAFEKPYTSKRPIEDRPGAQRYRGFHTNDMVKCIGCGTCESICQNEAIDLVPVDEIESTYEDSGLRPKIDYGRCCWCALCVDICPTGSLGMSNEYIWVDNDPEVFRFVPGADLKAWQESELGYTKPDGYRLLDPERQDMPMLDFNEGIESFTEMVRGYSKQQAIQEADRCVECGLCVANCPAHMDIPDYIRAIREDKLDDAMRLLYRTNPFPAVCGRVCTRRCEDVCAIGHYGDPIAIRWLKRYIADQFDLPQYETVLPGKEPDTGKKVAVIGGGPGGLSAAYYLTMMGHSVKVFEEKEHAGGMLRYGIPEYRLPYEQLDREIEYIRSLGVEIKTGIEVGEEIAFQKLYNDFDAVFMSTGLPESYRCGVPGEDSEGVIPALDLLEDVTRGVDVEVGENVAVIGGGNSAVDSARTARRLGAEVTILYRRREVDMPADDEEIHEAKCEGIEIITQAVPVNIKRKENNLCLTWSKAKLIDQGEGKRPRPVVNPDDMREWRGDTIITAIGQDADCSFIQGQFCTLVKLEGNRPIVDANCSTTDPKVYSGGDLTNSRKDAISAIADGHRAALNIDKYLRDTK